MPSLIKNVATAATLIAAAFLAIVAFLNVKYFNHSFGNRDADAEKAEKSQKKLNIYAVIAGVVMIIGFLIVEGFKTFGA